MLKILGLANGWPLMSGSQNLLLKLMRMVQLYLTMVMEIREPGKLLMVISKVIWESGKKDYIFNGVMGFQRLNKGKQKSYTSGMKKLLN